MRRIRRGSSLARTAATLALAVALTALAPARAAAQAPPPWKEYRSAEGGFTILLPTQPKVETKSTDTDLGPIEMHLYSCTTDNLYCSVAFYDVPSGASKAGDKLLDDTCNGFVQGAKLNEKAERRPIDIDGHPGREIMGESADGSFLLVVRYYLVDKRIYLVMIGTAIADAASPQVGRYLDSFRLLA